MDKQSLDLAYEFVPRSYEWASARFIALERRADVILAWATSVSLGMMAMTVAGLSNYAQLLSFLAYPHSIAIVLAVAFLVIALALCIASRMWGGFTVRSLNYIKRKANALSYEDFQSDLLKQGQRQLDKNTKVILVRWWMLNIAVACLLLEGLALAYCLYLVTVIRPS